MEIPKQLIDDGYVTVQKHPEVDYYIYNYTNQAVFDRVWERWPIVKKCRGLILDGKGNIIARPFEKFFNYEEYNGQIPDFFDFEVYEKLDGSLGILYHIDKTPYIATRGSFTSSQAIEATKILHEKWKRTFFDPRITFLFEIIYPENRIVVHYGDRRELVLLAGIYKHTGFDVDYNDLQKCCMFWNMPLVKNYGTGTDLQKLREIQEENKEGFVIKFNTGLRIKMKFEEYVRLHRIVTGVSSKSIWELLSNGHELDEVINNVPDEFFDWVRKVENDLKDKFKEIEEYCRKDIDIMLNHTKVDDQSMKDVALWFQTRKYPAVLFAMWKEKPYTQIIWKLIKPVFEQPFRDKVKEEA